MCQNLDFIWNSHRILMDFSQLFFGSETELAPESMFLFNFCKKTIYRSLHIYLKKKFSKFFLCASTWRGRNFCLKSRRIFNICCFLFLQQKKFTESFLIKYKNDLDRWIFDFWRQSLQMACRNFCHMIFQLIF